MRRLGKLDSIRQLEMLEDMGGDERRWICFTCTECIEVAVLVNEVAVLRQMVEFRKETIAAHDLEDREAETWSGVTEWGVAKHFDRRDGHRYRG